MKASHHTVKFGKVCFDSILGLFAAHTSFHPVHRLMEDFVQLGNTLASSGIGDAINLLLGLT